MIEHLQEQVRLLLARRFAPSSEKIPDGQLGLFNEAEATEAEEPESAPATEVGAHRRGTPKRAPIPEALPRIDIEHRLPEDERTCPHHGVELERFGEVVSEQLDIIPMQVRCCVISVASTVAPVAKDTFAPPRCRRSRSPRASPAPDCSPASPRRSTPMRCRCIASASNSNAGVELSRTTLARWMVCVGELAAHQRAARRARGTALPADGRDHGAGAQPGKTPESKSQLWAQMSAGPEPPIVLFEYDPTRAGDVPKRLLAGFTGALHTDGYSGYAPVVREQGLVHLACWAHARRGCVDVLKSLGLNAKKLPANPPAKARRALYALQQIRTLYAIERRIRDKRHLARQAESVPVLDKLRAWLDDTIDKVPPSTPLGKAMGYLHNQWKGLVRFCDDGRYGIDTNPVENAIRPFCGAPQLAIRRYRGRRQRQRPTVLAHQCARLYSLNAPRRTGSSPTPTCAMCSPSCPRRNHSPRSKPCCRPVSTPPPWRQIPSKSPSSPHVNSAVSGALTGKRLYQCGPGDVIEPWAAFSEHLASTTAIARNRCRAMVLMPTRRELLEWDDNALTLRLFAFLIRNQSSRIALFRQTQARS